MIRITRDELKSSANENLMAVAGQITQDVENFYRYTWLSPLKLMKKVVESKHLGPEEKLSLLTEEMRGAADLVAIQISFEGVESPLLITQDNFSEKLKKLSLNPAQILELTSEQLAGQQGRADIFAGDLTYLSMTDTWLISIIIPLDEKALERPRTLSARITLSRLIHRIRANPFNKIGMITLIGPEGRYVLGHNRVGNGGSDLVETVQKMLNSDIRTMGTNFSRLPSGEKMLGAYAITSNPAFGVIVEMSEINAYAAVTKMVENFITWILFGFSIAAIGAIGMSVSLTKPLRKLAQAARMISKGDFSAASDINIRSRDEVGMLARGFVEMTGDLEELYKTLEQKVRERTEALNQTLAEAREANEKIMESIRYAKMIQRSLLPNLEEVKAFLPESFFIWMPKDIVGGDAFFVDFFANGFIIAVIDCTGHGVPGAFMTMIASSAMKRIIKDESCYDPGDILRQLNFVVKTSLQQDTEHAVSNDGLDAGICFVRLKESYHPSFVLTFAGAKLPLFYVHNDEATLIKGDRQSIGYKRSNLDFQFTNHTIQVEKGMSFYMYSDGFADQMGGDIRRRFGTKRLKELLKTNSREPFSKQREILLHAFEEHRGEDDRQDDVTMVGFGF